jgi:hypothetical protein
VQAGGYRSGSANFRTIVNQRLITEKRFKNAGRGMYLLDGTAGGNPKRSRPRRPKRRTQRKK